MTGNWFQSELSIPAGIAFDAHSPLATRNAGFRFFVLHVEVHENRLLLFELRFILCQIALSTCATS